MDEEQRLAIFQQLKKVEIIQQIAGAQPNTEFTKAISYELFNLSADTLHYLKFFPEYIQELKNKIKDLEDYKR